VKINGTNLENIKKIVEINNLLKGPIGTKVMVTIRNSRGTKEIELIRKDLSLQNKMSPVDNLPNTGVEVDKVENILENKMGLIVNKFTNDNATEENVKSINNMDIIHIATHSFFLNRESDIVEYNYTPVNGVYAYNYYGNSFFDNGLVFSGVNNFNLDYYNGSKENGFLYSCEISNLNWDNTELVVLSSCESGMGLHGTYSSNIGLIGALQKAGVKNVIASLWNVDDKVTQEFMVEFYGSLAQDKSISESLRLAKLAIKKNHPEPYYWAPFVLYTLN
jgi:CHAT domain-containing protein